MGTIDQYYHRSRDKADLQFSCLTDHDCYPDWISQSEWELMRTTARLMNEDDALTCLLSFEWTPNEFRYDFGHKNVYYRDDNGDIFRSGDQGGITPTNLYASLKNYRAMCIPHHPAADWGMVSAATDWDFHDDSVERLAEIFSRHAPYEDDESRSKFTKNIKKMPHHSVQEALSRGYRMGFTAGSDSHQMEHGVEGGIERVSRYMMPILLVLVVVIAGYALTLRHEDASGQMRTGLEGLRYYLTPHMEGLTVSRFLQILLDAMSQLFFSLSVSMGIMITYGSYVKPDVDLNKAVNQIEIFDTGVALLAGAMIIPAVYVFSGTEGMSAGPSLMFVSLPKVFAAMGKAGTFVGILFFVTAIFATLTSCISVLESITANCMEIFHSGRKKTVLVLAVIYLAASAIIALGYSIFYFEVQLPNGSAAQLLDIMDYVSNSVMMPFIALLSTILIGWVMTPDYVINEMQRGGETFRRKKLYRVMIRYVAPVMMLVLFLQSTGILA